MEQRSLAQSRRAAEFGIKYLPNPTTAQREHSHLHLQVISHNPRNPSAPPRLRARIEHTTPAQRMGQTMPRAETQGRRVWNKYSPNPTTAQRERSLLQPEPHNPRNPSAPPRLRARIEHTTPAQRMGKQSLAQRRRGAEFGINTYQTPPLHSASTPTCTFK